ncbi:enoyl-CoA hydratase/isomerase family protein [Paraburkholderia sp. BCC1884]|uniref:enoyl-CoA hydratase/isomerase family protein n=1 Tax=Paraburkholderia sp. BCC1884 TaxID=2562668 RepID=UPI00118404BF|nr:enoyl-CoA hydratase-related protein [Paraburkholderia sp. BCC1884]
MDLETLRVAVAPGTEPEDGITVLSLNRPSVMNAMNTQMFLDLRVALDTLAHASDLRVLLITGEGSRAFCAGGDLKERNGMSDDTWRRQHQLIEEAFLAMKDFPLPVIAAVEGHAHGGGLELAMMADFMVVSESAVLSLAEVKRGIMPGGGGVQNLVRAAGMRRAKQLLFTGDAFSGAQAVEWGVANELTPQGEALSAAVSIARRIVAAAPMSVRYVKLSASRGGEVDFHTGYAMDIAAYNALVSTQDRLEGVAAFNERRSPRWRNG